MATSGGHLHTKARTVSGANSPARWAVGGVLVGVVVGGITFRWASFWHWVQGADWSSLPAVTVGTAVPAIAGVLFAQTLAKRSVRTLREVELETTELHNQSLAAAAEVEREARRRAWDGVFDACNLFTPNAELHPQVGGIVDIAKQIDKEGRATAESMGQSYVSIKDRALSIARYAASWGIELRLHLPALVGALTSLVHEHHVETMRVPLTALQSLQTVVLDEARWVNPESDAVIHAAQNNVDHSAIIRIGSQSCVSIFDLRLIAAGQREVPHAAEDVSVIVTHGFGEYTRQVNALRGFADLVDLLERDGAAV